jgi:hypothetical protein
MRRLLLGLAAALVLFALAMRPGVGRDTASTGSRAAVPASPPPAAREPTAEAAVPARDLFEYVDENGPVAPGVGVPSTPPEAGPAETAHGVRLIGFVRQGGAVRAALWVEGEVIVAGPGEGTSDLEVLSVDEDVGVRVRLGDGAERLLAPEP